VWGQPPVQLDVSEEVAGDSVTLRLSTSGPIFQPQPYVALKDCYAQYSVVNCSNSGLNTWVATLPLPRTAIAKVGVAVTDPAGNVASRVLRYVPDDLYVDNSDSEYSVIAGTWLPITNAAWGTNAQKALVSATEEAAVQWVLPVTWTGRYDVYVQVPLVTNAASNLFFQVFSGGASVLNVATTRRLPALQWVYLGSPYLDATLSNYLSLVVPGSNQPLTYAVADAVKLSPLTLAKPGFITQVTVDASQSTATLTWTTLAPAASVVEYGSTPAYGSYSPTNALPMTRHAMTLIDLKPDATNYFQIDAMDNGVQYTYQGSFMTTNPPWLGDSTWLIELSQVWRYTTNNLTGTAWRNRTYNDAAWPEGPGLLWVDQRTGGPNPAVQPRGEQMPANPGTHYPYTTYYFRTHFTFSGPAANTTLVFSNYIDDGAVFYLNGVELQRNNLPAAPAVIANSTLASGYNCGGDATCPVVFSITGKLLTNLVQGDNVLAVEVHNYSATSPDVTFGTALLCGRSDPGTPQLGYVWSSPYLTLYWSQPGCTLQQCQDLDQKPETWADVPGPATRSPYTVTSDYSRPVFYRLRR
jgi:hypothetical protein